MSEPQYEIVADRSHGPATILRLKGRLDASAAEQLRRHCMEQREGGHEIIVIDMSELHFIASSGLGTLLMLKELFGERGGRVVYSAPSPEIKQVIDMLNLEQFLDIEPTLEEAITVAVK